MADYLEQPIELDLPLVRGDTFGPVILTLKDDEGLPIDLTDFAISVFFDSDRCGPIKKTDDGTLVLSDPTNGQIPLAMTAQETTRLMLGSRARWAMRTSITDPDDGEQTRTLFRGRLIVNEGSPCE